MEDGVPADRRARDGPRRAASFAPGALVLPVPRGDARRGSARCTSPTRASPPLRQAPRGARGVPARRDPRQRGARQSLVFPALTRSPASTPDALAAHAQERRRRRALALVAAHREHHVLGERARSAACARPRSSAPSAPLTASDLVARLDPGEPRPRCPGGPSPPAPSSRRRSLVLAERHRDAAGALRLARGRRAARRA